MRRIRVLFLGGTIAMSGASPTLGGAQLVAALDLPPDIRLDVVDVTRVDSSALTFATCLEAFGLADRAVTADAAEGVVVVQGTDTLEETAYLWDLLWAHDVPVVVTGAMRTADSPGADGPANLRAAVRVASSSRCRGLGVLVVLADEIHAARHVTKQHTTSTAAFGSPDLGPLGTLREDGPVVLARVPRREALAVPGQIRPVSLVRATLDDDPRLYRAAAEIGDALVVEGLGAGQVGPEVGRLLAGLAGTMPVVLASRTGAGAVATGTYSGPGSGTELVAAGAVAAGSLSGPKARVLLTVLISGPRAPSAYDVAHAFERHGS